MSFRPSLRSVLSAALSDGQLLDRLLCDLEGRTHKEAASRLGWPIGTLSSRLSRGRTLLASRLSRQGVSLSAGTLAALLAHDGASASSMPTHLIGSTVHAACLFAAGGAVTAGVVSVEVADLIGEVLKVMLLGKLKIASALLVAASVFVAGGTGLGYRTLATKAPIQETKPNAPAIQEAKPIAATTPDPISTPQPIQEARPAEPPRTRNDRDPRSPTPTSGNQPFPASVAPSDPPDPELVPQGPIPPNDQDQLAEDPLAEQIMTGGHSAKQLERAKTLIESMLTLEKEAHSKSPEELTRMINARAGELEEARWQLRVMTAQLRRLTKIKENAQAGAGRRLDLPPTGESHPRGSERSVAPATEGTPPANLEPIRPS